MKNTYSVLQRIPVEDKPKIVDYTKYFHTMNADREEKPRKADLLVDHNYWFIGDLHGNIKEYHNILKKIRKQDPNCITIQVGDIELEDSKVLNFLGKKDFFIQGNHDYLKPCQEHPNFLGKFGYKHGIFYLGGAKSNGIGYKNEELSSDELKQAIVLFEKTKPDIVVTHDCPHSMREYFFNKHEHTLTSDALQDMWNIHAPKVWAFGHYHWGQNEIVDGTHFMCLSTMQYRQIKLSWTSDIVEREAASQPIKMTAGKALKRFLEDLALTR